MAKEIFLNRGMIAIVDDEDYERLNQFKWTYQKHARKSTGYAVRGVLKEKDKTQGILMHRELLTAPHGLVIDHINGNGLDNRKQNLRICTSQQNQWNMKIPKHNTSGFKGVHWHPQSQMWRARISVNRKMVSLGLYKTKQEAAIAWNKSALEYRGEFVRLNQI